MKHDFQIILIEDLVDFVYRSKLKGFAKTDKNSLNDQSSIYSNRELL